MNAIMGLPINVRAHYSEQPDHGESDFRQRVDLNVRGNGLGGCGLGGDGQLSYSGVSVHGKETGSALSEHPGPAEASYPA
ncbi:hypothetical protein NSPZN2_60011 [Nitrospira defluvii]|uniref:Uncharacterized protein n=1 Tax=Nitrospira defluvii TaxID=330214 RepID=A0ABN7M8B1_9BACT|nr:hypothetical protein NSPZN2_60011 [Nitrospira defluvii]